MLLEKTQRRLCRLLFVLGCVLPTLAVAGVTVGRVRPGFTAGLLAAASEQLGVRVTCDRLATPRPGVYALEAVRLLNPATGDELAQCDRLRLEWCDSGWRFVGGTARLSPRVAEARWLRRLLASATTARGELTQLSLGESSRLPKVALRLGKPAEGGGRLQISSADGWKLDATEDSGATWVAIETGASGLAAEWLSATPLRWAAGEGARFTGRIAIETPESTPQTGGSLEGVLHTGRLNSTQLTAAEGEVRFDTLRWTGEQVELLEGRIDLRDGQLSQQVVRVACESLLMPWRERLGELWEASQETVPYTQLACEIELGPKGVTLVAGCGEIDGQLRPGAVAHAVLEHGGEALLLEPAQHPLPTQRLVQTWFPNHRPELPADQAAIDLMRALPAPSLLESIER